ncbi:N,N-dimethylformamidase beta subunit family domain-containing protein [Dictyobacter aurantiacus]|uniref:N,N-dimethylformamidase beta subunit-like C-terminal domain-containing protein n=1 Tax=Dictyobacter aurantiacus TaxID=1936993 RepID=A0A401ZA25_9CHLR|nr:N,N-dimethylformamidase beta subunit family domain-containing protein [Dictyobacter aurantiacus]GCE03721.1 hypothetical protein KDAU_10500 [Dictyobacter aurantiacus]
MKFKSVVTIITIFIIAGALISFYFLAPSLSSSASNQAFVLNEDSNNVSAGSDNAITRENALTGTTSWKIPTGSESTTQIQGYVSATSVKPGKSLMFYVSTQVAQTSYRIDIFRLGWYSGLGGRLMTSVPNLSGQAQGYYDTTGSHLVNCTSCTIAKDTGLIETHWKPSYTLHIPTDWTTGIYLAKFTDINGKQSYAPFDVLGSTTSPYIAVTPDTTYAAYNDWGGSGLYDADDLFQGTAVAKRAVKVSLDKPYDVENGASQVLVFIVQTVRWMEQHDYDVSYASDLDLQANPHLLDKHKAFISLGHDEYWTKSMRATVEKARNKGIGLAFMGANAIYWQMRFEPDSDGVANRTIVSYKVQTDNQDLARDPMYGKDNSVVTAMWRDPVVGRPENAVVGVLFSNLTHDQNGFPWRVAPQAVSLPLLKDTNLQPNQSYGCGVVGYEWDRAHTSSNGTPDNPSYSNTTPKNLHIISASPTVSSETRQPDVSNSAYYIAPSGALVFATGSIYWETTLDSYRAHDDPKCGDKSTAVPEMQVLMKNVMAALIVKHNPNSF